MDKSPEEDDQATVSVKETVVPVGEIQQQAKSNVRRRLVQSTLLPRKPAPIELIKGNGEDKEKEGDDDVDCCENQGKKKRAPKRKQNPQPKTTKKAKVESSPESTPDKDATPKKSVKRAPRNNSTPDQDATPKKSVKRAPRKNTTPRKSVTPKKNGITNGKSAALSGENGDSLPQMPNLRLEAKLMAEENSRVFNGKQIHPFFLSRTTGNKCQESTIKRKVKSNAIGPIHVFESEQDCVAYIDWKNWTLCEETCINTSCNLDFYFSSIFECTIKSLCFNNLSTMLHPLGSLVQPDNLSLDKVSAAAVSPNVKSGCYQPTQDAQMVDEVAVVSGCVTNPKEQDCKFLLESVRSSHFACGNHLDSRLWTDKYQPQKATEICGNGDSVRFLYEWLQTWCQKGNQAGIDRSGADACDIQDPDYNSSQKDSDTENEEDRIKNVLLITGPVGSGKSAAIYACSKELGFRVLEANASECRTGVIMKERFGALELQSTLDSQLLPWSQESSIEFQSVDDIKSLSAIPNGKLSQEFDNEVIEVISIPDEDISQEATDMSQKYVYKENSVASGQGQLKPLVLFEDVDIVFAEDRGFVSAIQQIADKVKGPVILTSNSDKPILPDNLDRLELCFKLPLEKELLQRLQMVCSAEKVNVPHNQVEELIKFCQRDIRKTIMHLQFWCQSELFRKGRGRQIHILSGLLPFDLEAGHQLFSKMIHGDFPSQLAELVEKEITTSLSTMEEITEDKFDDQTKQSNLEKCIYETDGVEAKKKAMLKKNSSDHEFMDFIDLFDSSSNPFPFSQGSSKRKLVIMSSDSEDEFLNEKVPTTPDIDANNESGIAVDGQFPSHCMNLKDRLSLSTDLQLCIGAEKLEENTCQCSETLNMLNGKDPCISIDLSCVPESSFVPETELNEGTELSFGRVFSGQVGTGVEILEEASVSTEFRQRIFAAEADKFVEHVPKFKYPYLFGGTCDVIAVSSHDEVEDSENELVESVTREHQLMDECSCIDFNKIMKPPEKSASSAGINAVCESWRKLRDRRADLNHLVAAELEYSRVIELACGMSNLISEAELLHAKCQSPDSMGLPMGFCEDSEAFSWCNEQLQMGSSILEHGFCSYAKDIASAGIGMGSDSRVNFNLEVPSLNNKMEVGDLVGQKIDGKFSDIGLGEGDLSVLENTTLPNREKNLHLLNIIRSMVPSRAYTAIKDYTFCEYLSSLGHMSRSETSRLSEGVNNTKRRRGRAARNYLSSGSLMLSPEEITLLGQSSIYANSSTQSDNSNIT